MNASSIPELGILYVSWINEQLRAEIARREERDAPQSRLIARRWLRTLVGALCPISLLVARFAL